MLCFEIFGFQADLKTWIFVQIGDFLANRHLNLNIKLVKRKFVKIILETQEAFKKDKCSMPASNILFLTRSKSSSFFM